MKRQMIFVLCLLLLPVFAIAAEEKPAAKTEPAGPKELSGMSIVGNDEAPKSLYIVPWKSSELGAETSLDMVLSARDEPVDREVFLRELEFYQVSRSKPTAVPQVAAHWE